MTKAQEMLAKAGFPDTAAGRAAFHKQYPTPDSFFQVHGSSDTEMYKAGGGIHIKPSKRGTFTAAAKKHGKSVQAFASQVLANKGNYSPAMVKKANFARNAAKWKHEDGGPVMYGDGGKLPEGILRSRLESHMNPNEVQSYIDSYNVGGMINNPPPYTEEEALMNARLSGQYYDRFPKKGSNFGYSGPGSFSYYMDRLKNTKIKTANPHAKKDAVINMHTITGSCEAGNCYEFADGGTVDALQLMGMPTPEMYGPGGLTGNPYSRFNRRGRNTGDDNITGFTTGFNNNFNLPQGYSSSGQSANVSQAVTPNLGMRTNITGLDYTKDFYNDNNVALGAGLSLGRGTQSRDSLFKTFNYTTPHGTAGTGFTKVADPETKNFMVGALHGNADAHIPLLSSSWGAQRQGHRNVGAGGIEIAGLNPSLEVGLDKFGSGKINPYYDASVGLGMLNNMFNVNAGYTNRTGNAQVSLPSGTTADAQKGRPYVDMGFQLPLAIDNKGNTRFKVFGGYGTGRGDNSGYAGATYTFADGGPITHYIPSYNFGHVQSANNTYRHGFANGGPVGMYGFGSTIKDLGYGLVDTQLSTIGGLTGIQSMQDIVDEDQYSNDKFDNVANFGGKAVSTAANFIPGAQPFLAATRGIGELANTTFKIDEKNYNPSQHTSNWDKWGNIVGQVGNTVAMFTNPASAASSLSKGAKTAMNIGKIAGLGATAVNAGRDIDKSRGGTYDPTNALNLGMGIAKSGFFGGNTNTSGNFGNNTKGAVDYTPSVDSPLYAAMGGAVNAPNMMKYDNGSSVSNTDNLSPKDQYNLFLKAKPVTKYFSNAQVPHPADGSMDPRGTVTGSVDPQTGEPIQINIEKNEANWKLPNSTNFITTKKDTEKILAFDKNNDGIAKASYMANIARAKAIKDAKAKSMMANGGMVGQYGYGGGVKMFAAGGPPYADNYSGYYDFGAGEDAEGNFDFSSTMNPAVGSTFNPYASAGPGDYSTTADNYVQPTSLLTPQLTPNVSSNYMLHNSEEPLQLMTTRGINTNLAPFTPQTPSAFSMRWNNMLAGNADLGEPKLLPGEAYDNQIYTPTSTSNVDGTPTPSWFDRNKEDLKTAGGKALMYGPGIYNIMRSFGKPFQMNAADYQIKGTVNPYEEEYVADYRPYNAAVANLNRMPGSANLAARTNLFNAMQQQQDDARYKNSLANAQRKMTADQAKLGIEGQNLNTAMQIAQLNEQNRAAKRNMLGQGFSDLSNIAQFERTNAMTGNALASIMQHYTVLPDGTMIPKAGYNPAAYSAIYNAGNTPTTNSYDPNLVSPNRYMNQGIDFTYSKPSFRKR